MPAACMGQPEVALASLAGVAPEQLLVACPVKLVSLAVAASEQEAEASLTAVVLAPEQQAVAFPSALVSLAGTASEQLLVACSVKLASLTAVVVTPEQQAVACPCALVSLAGAASEQEAGVWAAVRATGWAEQD